MVDRLISLLLPALILGCASQDAQRPAPVAASPAAVQGSAGGATASRAAAAVPGDVRYCPPAGMVVTWRMSGIDRNWQSLGASPDDATLCQRRIGGNSSLSHFNFHFPSDLPSKDEIVGIADVLAGRTSEFTYSFVGQPPGSMDKVTYQNTMRRLGTESVNIADRQMAVTVVQVEQRALTHGNAFQGRERRWHDPMTGLWVKRVVDRSGGIWGDDWEVVRIEARPAP